MPVSEGCVAICVLGSGSKGNAIYVSDGQVSLLVDAGLSGVEIERRMKSKGLNAKDLDAIIVSHEHTDHIQGVSVLSRRFHLPVYINPRTLAASGLKSIYKTRHFECGTSFEIDTLAIHPFSISHDAEDPAGFTIQNSGIKIGIATDLGTATAVVRQHLKGCSALIIEANHDLSMLINGPYPWHLKQRVKGRTGHLSNEESKDLLKDIQHDGLQYVILSHLSEINNTPEKAASVVSQGLNGCSACLSVATQNGGSPVLRLFKM